MKKMTSLFFAVLFSLCCLSGCGKAEGISFKDQYRKETGDLSVLPWFSGMDEVKKSLGLEDGEISVSDAYNSAGEKSITTWKIADYTVKGWEKPGTLELSFLLNLSYLGETLPAALWSVEFTPGLETKEELESYNAWAEEWVKAHFDGEEAKEILGDGALYGGSYDLPFPESEEKTAEVYTYLSVTPKGVSLRLDPARPIDPPYSFNPEDGPYFPSYEKSE